MIYAYKNTIAGNLIWETITLFDDNATVPDGFVQYDPEELDVMVPFYFDTSGNYHSAPLSPDDYYSWDADTASWVDARTEESQWAAIRKIRDALLLATDWTQLPDVPLSTQEMYRDYRQALRDVTLQLDPFNIVWPKV